MTTTASLKRLLLRHVPGIASADIATVAPFRFEARLTALPGVEFEDVKAHANELLDRFRVAGVGATIMEGPGDSTIRSDVPPRLALAAHLAGQTVSQLKKTLVAVVPALGRLVVVETKDPEPRGVRFEVGHEDGSCSAKLLGDVRAALLAVGYAGLPFDVAAIAPSNSLNQLKNSGFTVPRREPRIVRATEEDEDIYATRIQALVTGKVERFSPVDDFAGTAVFSTPSLKSSLVPIHCILPLYDRIYVEMLGSDKEPETYFERHFGMSREDFLEFTRLGRIMPVFKFNLGRYPREVIDPWLDRPDLPFISPRQLDFVALRHGWTSSPVLALLRNDREAARELLRVSIELNDRFAQSGPEAMAREIFAFLTQAAESFEGLAFHRGHIALGDLSPGAAAVQAFAAKAASFESKAIAQTVELDAHVASKDIALAQAFNASLNEGMMFNLPVLNAVLPFFRSAPPVIGQSAVDSLAQLVDVLELSYNRSVPAAEYAEVFDQAETKRIWAITAELLQGSGDSILRQELREKVLRLNGEVGRLRQKALEVGEVDVVGDLGKAGGLALGSGAIVNAVTTVLGLGLAKRIAANAFEEYVEGSELGTKLDKIRGAVNRVSPAAIRIYRVRSKLQAGAKK
ncbi:MAG TPA: hypothetical protein VHP33_06260 [Polyangiaceae bacterium]|nr:hypothetical protein [Polyangiaceae bacterium]